MTRNKEVVVIRLAEDNHIVENADTEIHDPEMEELLDSFGKYTDVEIEFVKELNKYRLA
jgi:heat shock protein HspQ